MSVSTVDHRVLDPGEPLLTFPEVAEALDVPVTKVYDLVRDNKLLAVRTDEGRAIPRVFFTERQGAPAAVNRFVPGLIALMSDGGYSSGEILRYLFTPDESLPGRPVDALHGHLAREVMRRAQAMAF